MKKLITAMVLGAVLIANSAFADKNENVNYRVENAFNQEFTQAKEVNWQKSGNFYKASFKIGEEVMMAYYTTDGEFVGVIHNMLSTELPINLQASIKKDYDNYWITELFEIAKPEGHSYYITLHNADQIVTLQSTDGFAWSVYNKTKKQ